jgi:hypothetical protein
LIVYLGIKNGLIVEVGKMEVSSVNFRLNPSEFWSGDEIDQSTAQPDGGHNSGSSAASIVTP